MRTTLLSLLLLLATAGWTRAQDDLGLIDLGDGIEGNAFFSPYEDVDKKILGILDRAKPGSTVYQSYYSLSYAPYFWKYRQLAKQGVTVKVNLWDGSNKPETEESLKKAGVDNAWILNIRRPPPENWSSMHTKFTVVNREWVISGSANLSNSASLANHEHIIILRSPELAEELIKEFEEQRAASEVMRGYDSIDGEDDPQYQEMMDKLKQVDQPTTNTATKVQTWFSPEDGLKYRVTEQIDQAQQSVKIAMYTFFSPAIGASVRRAADRGVKCVLLLDAHQHHGNELADFTLECWCVLEQTDPEDLHPKPVWQDEQLVGFDIDGDGQVDRPLHPNVTVLLAETSAPDKQLGTYAALHHKYAVIDDQLVIGGSFNWTGTAHHYNDENMVVVRSKPLAARFTEDFSMMLRRYHPDTLAALRQSGFLPASFPGETTTVLFAVSYTGTDPQGHNAWDWKSSEELVVVGNVPALGDGDPARGLLLRGSQSVSPRMLASVDLPRGAKLQWRVCVRSKQKNGFSNVVNGSATQGETRIEAEARNLTVDGEGTPMIVGPKQPAGLQTDTDVSWSKPILQVATPLFNGQPQPLQHVAPTTVKPGMPGGLGNTGPGTLKPVHVKPLQHGGPIQPPQLGGLGGN